MSLTCWTCQLPGHTARECPNASNLDIGGDGRPMWCGSCDERSRHIELVDGRVKRCQCHPESHKKPPQHRACPGCGELVVSWDVAPCGQHSLAATVHPYVGPAPLPPKPDSEEALRLTAASQVMRSRLARLVT